MNSVVAVWSSTARATGFLVDARGLIATHGSVSGPSSPIVAVQVSPDLKVHARVLYRVPRARSPSCRSIPASSPGAHRFRWIVRHRPLRRSPRDRNRRPHRRIRESGGFQRPARSPDPLRGHRHRPAARVRRRRGGRSSTRPVGCGSSRRDIPGSARRGRDHHRSPGDSLRRPRGCPAAPVGRLAATTFPLPIEPPRKAPEGEINNASSVRRPPVVSSSDSMSPSLRRSSSKPKTIGPGGAAAGRPRPRRVSAG